jgi:hypothetical protein
MSTHLKLLLQARHLQAHAAFCREYDRLAKRLDPALVNTWPSRATLHRWMTGGVKRLPYGPLAFGCGPSHALSAPYLVVVLCVGDLTNLTTPDESAARWPFFLVG